jgi:hypothetical protein
MTCRFGICPYETAAATVEYVDLIKRGAQSAARAAIVHA